MKKYCLVCNVDASRELAGKRYIEVCEHAGEKRFIYCGPAPKKRRDAEKIARVLMKAFGLLNKPGPRQKRQISELDVWRAMEQLPPDTSLSRLASEMDVPVHKIQRALKRTFSTFTELKAALNSVRKSRLSSRLKQRRRDTTN